MPPATLSRSLPGQKSSAPHTSALRPLPNPAARRLTAPASLLLDLIRFAAAAVVFWSHLAEPRFTSGLRPRGLAGHLAVAVFFVLSGFIIRHVSLARLGTARTYLADRASRIYSVVLPCLVLTVVLEALAALINHALYTRLWEPFAWPLVPLHLLANLTFLSQLWGYQLNPLSNSPFWSIAFECFYYAFYGLAFYTVRRRWLWTAALALLAGPAIVLLLPIWLLGALTSDLFARLERSRHAPRFATFTLLATLLLLALLRHPLTRLLAETDTPHRNQFLTGVVFRSLPATRLLFPHLELPWLAQASPSFLLFGTLTALGLLWALLHLNRFAPVIPHTLTRAVRTLADSTFTLYLLHLPLLILIVDLTGHPLQGTTAIASVFLGIIVAALPLARLFDRFKLVLRRRFLNQPAVQPQPLSRAA